MTRERLLVSFSGGRTSGYMTRRLLAEYADRYEMAVVFANTGEENEATLEFVRDCDKHFGFGTVWIEGVTNPAHGQGMRHRVVTFETASRKGEPFEAVIAKYGIANRASPHCTKNLKRRPMESYMRAIGWGNPNAYAIAIGIRADEARRVNPSVDRKVVYPLVDWFPTDKAEVNDWWLEQPFNLALLEHQGNCKWCWKKSFRKHARLIRETPDIYDFPRRMEARYGHVRPPQAKRTAPSVFFREDTSTLTLFKRCELLTPWAGERERPDENGGCTESCELLPTSEQALLEFGADDVADL
jgi:hypothetical protein